MSKDAFERKGDAEPMFTPENDPTGEIEAVATAKRVDEIGERLFNLMTGAMTEAVIPASEIKNWKNGSNDKRIQFAFDLFKKHVLRGGGKDICGEKDVLRGLIEIKFSRESDINHLGTITTVEELKSKNPFLHQIFTRIVENMEFVDEPSAETHADAMKVADLGILKTVIDMGNTEVSRIAKSLDSNES